MDTPAVSARLIGAIFVEKGLITDEQLTDALEQQRATGERVGEILVAKFGVSRLALASALAEQWAEYERPRTVDATPETEERDLAAVSGEWPSTTPAVPAEPTSRRPIGEIFRERGLLTEEQLEEALAAQAKSGQRLGEVLVAKGVVSRLELASALAEQWASLQKLRPPASEHEEQSQPSPPREVDATPTAAPREAELGEALAPLRADIDAVAARLEQDGQTDNDLERLEGRLNALERAHMDSGVVEELRADVGELRERIAELATEPTATTADHDLEPLRERLAALEQKARETDDFEGLRARLDGLAARIAAVPPFDEAELVSRLDAVEGRLQTASDSASALDERVSSALAGATDGLHLEVDDLRGRMAGLESTGGSIEELRAELATLERRVPDAGELRAELAALADRVDSIPASFDTKLGEISERAARAASDRADLDALAFQIEELVEASTRTPSASTEDLEEIRRALAALDERVASAAQVRDEVAGLAEQLGAVPASLESRLEELADRISQADTLGPKLDELQAELQKVAARTAAPDSDRADLEALRSSVSLLEARLGDADAIGAELRALSERVASIPSSVESQVEALRARVEDVAAGDDAVASLAGRVDELASQVAGALQAGGGDVEQLRSAIDEVAAGRREVEEGLQSRLDELEMKLEDGAHARPDVRTELQPLLRDATESIHEELRQVRTRLDESATLRGALDAMGERLQELEQRRGAAEFEQQARELAAAIESSAAALRAEQEELRARIERDAQELARTDDVERRLVQMEERLTAADDLEQQLTRSLETLGEEAIARIRRGDDELRSTLTSLIQESAEAAHAARVALTKRVDDLAAEIAATGELTETVNQVQGRLDAGEIRDPRVDELERRVEAGEAVEDRLRGMVAPLAEAADAIQADQSALRQALGQALNRLSSVDSVADRLAELERRLAEGEELESRLRESLNGLVAESASELQGDQAELREQIQELAAEAEMLRSLADRVAAAELRLEHGGEAEKRLGESLSRLVRETRDELLAEHAALRSGHKETAGRLDEIEVLRERADDADERLGGLDLLRARLAAVDDRLGSAEAGLASRETVAELEDKVSRLESSTSGDTQELRGELAQLQTSLAAEIATGGARAVAEATKQVSAALERHAARHETLEAQIAEADVRGQLAAFVEETEGTIEALRERIASGSKEAKKASERAEEAAHGVDKAVDALRAELTGTHAQFADSLDEQLEVIERRLKAAAHDATTLSERLEASERRHAETHETLETTLREIENRIDDGALRSAERTAAVEHALRRELANQGETLDDQAAALNAQAESIDSLASAVEEREAATVDAREELREELERISSSFGWRIERVEEALARDDTSELRRAVEELAERLDKQSAVSEEQVRVTEKALRKGLASLGSRLAETEETYVDAGNALRRSIERLGLAIEQADDGIEQRVSPQPDRQVTEAFVAFAPTGDGYRLVEIGGPLPDVGGELTIPESDGTLRVTRIGESPLPLDMRPCAFLERKPAE